MLHSPQQTFEELYLQFIQIVDEYNTTPEQNFYESFICTLKYNKISYENAPRYYREIFGYGYRGKSFLHDTVGQHGSLNVNEHSSFQPWRLDLRRGRLTTDEERGTGINRCTFKRNFDTPHSFIVFKEGMTLNVITGYKMYENGDEFAPKYKGISGLTPMQWVVLEGAYSAIGTYSLALSLLMMNALF